MTYLELIEKYKAIYGVAAANNLEVALKKGVKPSTEAVVNPFLSDVIKPKEPATESKNKVGSKAKNIESQGYHACLNEANIAIAQEMNKVLSAGTPVGVTSIAKDTAPKSNPVYVNMTTYNPQLDTLNDSPFPLVEPSDPMPSMAKKWSAYCKNGPSYPRPGSLFQWHIPENFLCGIEYEVECVLSYHNKEVAGFCLFNGLVNTAEDNSLKFHGKEFITTPMDLKHHLLVYQALFADGGIEFLPTKDILKNENPFSRRTSTHVHVNMLALEQPQILALIWWYYLLEPLFFDMAHPSRATNIHCVQLRDTNMHKLLHMNNTVAQISDSWHKYTAFNIKPLKQQGTIEFRHREGISSLESLKQWLEAIESWYQAVVTRGLTVDKIKALIRSGDSLAHAVLEYSPAMYTDDLFAVGENKLLEASIPLRLAMLRNF